MALTKTGTDGIKNDAITGAKIADDAIGAEHIEVLDSHLQLADNCNVKIGTGDDLKLYHNGSDSTIMNSTGNLTIATDDLRIKGDGYSETMATFVKDGAVELYHNNVKTLETTANGIDIIDDDTSVNIRFLDSNGLTGYAYGSGSSFGLLDKSGNWKVKVEENAQVELYHHTSKKFETSSVGVSSLDTLITHGVIRPANDNDHAIGLSNRRYTEIFAVNGSINTSDRTEKNTIVESDLGLDFINKLKPVSYKWNKDDGKTHYGLIAQDIEETITSLGKTVADFGGISKEKDSPMGLSYSELLSPIIKTLQELSAEVTTLKTKVAVLEAA